MENELYSIEVSDQMVFIYGDITMREAFDFLAFFDQQGYSYLSVGYNSTLCLTKEDCRKISKEIIDKSEEEESSEENYFTKWCDEKVSREDAELILEEEKKKNKILEKSNDSIKLTRRSIFDLQDLVMRLIKFKKIDAMEWPHVISILRNTGVEDVDIKVMCNFENLKQFSAIEQLHEIMERSKGEENEKIE